MNLSQTVKEETQGQTPHKTILKHWGSYQFAILLKL